jgi:hypothetical protein
MNGDRTMPLRFEFAFPAGVEAVHAVLTDPEFLREYAYKTESRQVSVATAGAATRVRRVMPTDGVPPFARPFLGDEVPVQEVVTWRPLQADGTRWADLAVHAVAGSRQARLRGTLRLEPAGSGCRLLADGELRVKVPLVGARLAPLVEQVLRGALRVQCELAAQRLGSAEAARHDG